jgi:hypothetical protein
MSRERTDAELLRDARRDPHAFGELYARHVAAVHDWHARPVPCAAGRRTGSPGGGSVTRFPVYEDLPASALSDGPFSLQAQHPSATVKVDKLAYEAHWSELAPPKPS